MKKARRDTLIAVVGLFVLCFRRFLKLGSNLDIMGLEVYRTA
jgi:hypothetical protein